METSGYARGIPTYTDPDGKRYGMLCETKEKCISDDSGVTLDTKLEEMQRQISEAAADKDASTLEGHGAEHFATAESVTDIINGTQTVGNADKLDGHDIDEFMKNSGGIITGPSYFDNGAWGLNIRNTGIVKGTNPSAPLYLSLNLMEKDGNAHKNRIGQLQTSVEANGSVKTAMYAFKNEKDGTASASIAVLYENDGTAYGTAPTPSSTADASTKIATTKWVSDFIAAKFVKVDTDPGVGASVSYPDGTFIFVKE